ncbi:glycosyltransferase [Vibrio cholerae]|uniref:glycosyltransferase family protein n=1 Tax=Vibrio cholerae TaxID=666 RepID=UPI0039675BF7
MNIKILHIGSKYHGDNDIVSHFSSSLKKYSEVYEYWILPPRGFIYKNFWKRLEGPFHIWKPNYISIKVINRILESIGQDINCIVINSGGFFISKRTLRNLNDRGIRVVTISLSDPDVYKSQTFFQVRASNLHFTNSVLVKNKLGKEKKVKDVIFGVTDNKIKYKVDLDNRIYDIIVVGESRPERVDVIHEISRRYPDLKIGCYGRGWDYKYSCGYVTGDKLEDALNSGKIYISFSRTLCGYKNIKVGMFEAMSAGCCVISDNMSVLPEDLINGIDLFSVSSEDEIVELVGRLNETDIKTIANNGHRKLRKKFVWEKTINKFIQDVKSELF